jgi:hypothetical protein
MPAAISVALGLGLVIAWIAGLANHALGWLTWVSLAAALLAFGGAWAFVTGRRIGAVLAGFLGMGLLLVWLIALGARGSSWLTWWTFGFGSGFVILAILAFGTAAPRPSFR